MDAFTIVLFLFQTLMIVLWGIAVTFTVQDTDGLDIGTGVQPLFSSYIDMALITTLGFGLLLSFLRKYGHSSMGHTFFIVASMLQWAILNVGFWQRVQNGVWNKLDLNINFLILGIFGALAVVITFGVLAGKVSLLVMFILGFFEIGFWALNYYIGSIVLQADDFGMAIFTHLFGAMFGLGATIVFSYKSAEEKAQVNKFDNESSYTSDFLSLLGTVLMFVLWPSINSALANPAAQSRVVINTVLSLCSSCIFTFWVSRTFNRKRFGIRDIQNATLSGGVVMASSVASTIIPGAAMLVGAICATVVTIGVSFWKPYLDKH